MYVFYQILFYIESLRKLTGNDKEVYDYVMSQSETQEFVRRTIEYYDYLLKKYEEEGKNANDYWNWMYWGTASFSHTYQLFCRVLFKILSSL